MMEFVNMLKSLLKIMMVGTSIFVAFLYTCM